MATRAPHSSAPQRRADGLKILIKALLAEEEHEASAAESAPRWLLEA